MPKTGFHIIRYLPWYFLLLSMFISGILSFLFRGLFEPYSLKILEYQSNTDVYITYHDFNHDGFSESLEIRNNSPDYQFIHIKNWSGGIIDQTTYWEALRNSDLFFADITGDNFDEIFGFTSAGDSLFLYVHDLIAKTVLIERLFLGKPEESEKPVKMAVYSLGMADTSLYKNKVFFFATRPNQGVQPRSVFALDLEERRIIKEFQTNTPFFDYFMYDLTGDGIEEIIVCGAAWGNVDKPVKYRDDQCWLFVLDQQLSPVFQPLSFSEYPATISSTPVESHSNRYLLVVPNYEGNKKLPAYMYLIDSQGKSQLRTTNYFSNLDYKTKYVKPVVDNSKNPSVIFGFQGSNHLIRLNHQLEKVYEVETPFNNIRTDYLKDLDTDGNAELLCESEKYFLVYDYRFRLLSKFPKSPGRPLFTFRENGPGQPPDIGMHDSENFYRLSFFKNRLYAMLPLFYIGITAVVFLLLNGIYKISTSMAMYFHFYKYFFFDSSLGLLILNRTGKILYINTQVKTDLQLPGSSGKGEKIEIILNAYPKVLDAIQKSLKSRKPLQQILTLRQKSFHPEVEMVVQPICFFLRECVRFLVIIKSVEATKVSGKIQTWSRAVQKMAHDIKTPLSTVSLNLKVLQTRLEKITLSETDRLDLSDDINMMRTELENIQSMTKSFLKFSNLDKPHFQAFDIRHIIEQALVKYKPYFSKELEIQVSTDDDIKPVWADPHQIEMVFHVLLENALAAIKGKGFIRINISLAQYLDKNFEEYLEVELADSGPGISEEKKRQIFEPYFTTKEDGTGIGLAIAKKIIEDHSGSIDVHSKPGFGAVFRFSVPVIAEEGDRE